MASATPTHQTPILPGWIAHEVDFKRFYPDAHARIALAIALARSNVEHASGGPFGAAVFDAAGRLLAVGVNRVQTLNSSLAHAEIMALAFAQKKLGRARLNADGGQYTLATSAQPCCQCYGALMWAGLDTLLVAARAEDTEALAGFDEGPLPTDWIGELQRRGMRVERDQQRDAARAVLASYAARGGECY